jgi:xylan 1,4-beta-xylosidase
MALWNYASPGESAPSRSVTVHFQHTNAGSVAVWRLDAEHGDFHRTYAKMGSPAYPTRAQIQQLREATEIPSPETQALKNGELTLEIPPGLVLIELK